MSAGSEIGNIALPDAPPAGRSALRTALQERLVDPTGRRWTFVPYDQLTAAVGPLAALAPRELGVVFVECAAKARRRPYHKQKLALILANQRQFALELAKRGVAVRYVTSEDGYGAALGRAGELGPLTVMEPAERELRRELQPLVESGALCVVPHAGWLTTREQFVAGCGSEPPWRMDAFYRHVRRATGLLMEDGSPVGGRFSMDGDNREAWPGAPAAPDPPTFVPDAIDEEVRDLVEDRFAEHPGRVDLSALATTKSDAERLWAWAKEQCLTHFGPFEDALTERSRGLFHTRIAPLLNIHRLLPGRVVEDVAALDVPLSSKEGFVRQILGWREFVRHVHRETDGLRRLPAGVSGERARPGDGGFGRWRGAAWDNTDVGGDGGATPSELGADWPLPPAYWGTASGLRCLDHTVAAVLEDGWTHHIPRLMVLSNLATLLDVSPRDLTDWFWAAFVDAFDWVVEPNVLGMGTFAAGDVMTTKPYVSGSNYIHKMGDHCGPCAFHPKRDCPIAHLYWAFLARHEGALSNNRRMNLPLGSARRRSAAKRAADRRVFDLTRERLAAGESLTPADVAAAVKGDTQASAASD